MRKEAIFGMFLFGLILLSACEKIDVSKLSDKDLERLSKELIVCNKPYIRYASECCLDKNDNTICDRDEGLIEEKETPSGITPPVTETPAEPTKPEVKEKEAVEPEVLKQEKDYIDFTGKIDIKKLDNIGTLPKISDKYVIGATNLIYSGGSRSPTGRNISIYNLKTGEYKYAIFENVFATTGFGLYKNKIAYFPKERNEVIIYDIDLDKSEKITDFSNIIYFDFNDKYVVTSDGNHITIYNLKTKEQTLLENTKGIRIKIYEDIIIWLGVERENDRDYYTVNLYDIKSKKKQMLSRDVDKDNIRYAIYPYGKNPISIYDDKVLYSKFVSYPELNSGGYEIYMYDLASNQEKQLTSGAYFHIEPVIYKNIVVWQDGRSKNKVTTRSGIESEVVNYDIYGMDLRINKEFAIAIGSPNEEDPQIYGNNVVYLSEFDGIYLATLS